MDGGFQDEAELELGPAARARLYRERAAALEAELAATTLPRLREKLQSAIGRFHALADAAERIADKRQGGEADPATRAAILADALKHLASG